MILRLPAQHPGNFAFAVKEIAGVARKKQSSKETRAGYSLQVIMSSYGVAAEFLFVAGVALRRAKVIRSVYQSITVI